MANDRVRRGRPGWPLTREVPGATQPEKAGDTHVDIHVRVETTVELCATTK